MPRLFAAIPVPEPALSELSDILEGLRAKGWPVRWVRRDGLHITLKFYGAVAEEDVSTVETALGRATESVGSFRLCGARVEAFPPGRRARVVWMSLAASRDLELLQGRVERGNAAESQPVERRPFRPHITLGRVEQGARLPPSALTGPVVQGDIGFLADRVVLFESRSGRGGSVYTPRLTIGLKSCPVV